MNLRNLRIIITSYLRHCIFAITFCPIERVRMIVAGGLADGGRATSPTSQQADRAMD